MATDLTPSNSFQQGVDSMGDDTTEGKAIVEEKACTKQWQEKIKNARDFDREARKQMARDRKYARGDDGDFEVSVPIAPSYIDVLRSFLFARNPDVACEPSPSTNPPPQKELEQRARDQAQGQIEQQGQQLAGQLAPALGSLAANGALGGVIQQVAPLLQQASQSGGGDPVEQQAQDTAAKQAAPYQQMRQDAKQFAQTMELVIAQAWKMARLKEQGLPVVGSGLTVGTGWLKSTWQQRMGEDPIMRNTLNDLQDNLARIKETQDEIAEGEAPDMDALKASLAQQIEGIQAKVEVVVARGLAIDFVPSEDIQVATDCGPLANYTQSPWISHRTFIPCDEAKAKFEKVADKIKNAKIYFPRKPKDPRDNLGGINGNDPGAIANIDAKDADSYTTDNSGKDNEHGSVCVWEIWDKDSNMVLTLIDGVDVYALEPYAPDPGTTRFYPFFLYQIGVVDGERWPKSLVNRSSKLFDEYNRARSNWRVARSRAIPKCGFDDTNIEPVQADKLKNGMSQEMVGFHGVDPMKPLKDSVFPIAYADINEKLYDTAPIRAELETIWGIQEALSSSIHTAKTATEAEIQQTGTNSRTSYMRDGLDEMLTDLANYTAEIALQKMSHDDVVRIAGPNAFWPEGLGIEDMGTLVEVSIRAGSSGKPNTSQKQAVWAQTMPVIQQAIQTIGQLRGSDPDDIADCVEELVIETLNRTGERIDAERFLPEPPKVKAPPPGPPPPKPHDTAMQGPQIVAMTQVCDQVRQQILSPATAIAILAASFPEVPMPQIEQMVAGVAHLPPALPPPPKTPAIGAPVPSVASGTDIPTPQAPPQAAPPQTPPPITPANGTGTLQ